MTYNPHNLSVLAYANGFTLWHYTTTDTIDQVASSGYFNSVSDMLLRVGDMIMANCNTDGTPAAGIFLISRSSGGIIDVTRMV